MTSIRHLSIHPSRTSPSNPIPEGLDDQDGFGLLIATMVLAVLLSIVFVAMVRLLPVGVLVGRGMLVWGGLVGSLYLFLKGVEGFEGVMQTEMDGGGGGGG